LRQNQGTGLRDIGSGAEFETCVRHGGECGWTAAVTPGDDRGSVGAEDGGGERLGGVEFGAGGAREVEGGEEEGDEEGNKMHDVGRRWWLEGCMGALVYMIGYDLS